MSVFKKKLNAHGQPYTGFNAAMREGRNIDELIGICKGIVCDGAILNEEADFLLQWLDKNREIAEEWPASALYDRVKRALFDGVIDEDEEKELLETLLQASGVTFDPGAPASLSTGLAFDDPMPDLHLRGHYCFTGRFATGTRAEVEKEAIKRGATILKNITRKLNYLVIGVAGSRDWLHSTHGTKIQGAIECKSRGMPIAIVSERHWAEQIGLV